MVNHLRLSGAAEATTINYTRAVRDLMHATGKTPDQLCESGIIDHLNRYRDRKKLSPSALNIRICGIKYYFREVAHRLDIDINIPNPRRVKQIGDILTPAEVNRLCQHARSIRHLAVLQLLIDTGLRAREAGRLRLGDFDKSNRSITVRTGKGGKHRTVLYGAQLRNTLNEYFRQRRPKDYLFPGAKGNPFMSVRGVQWIVRESVKRARIQKDIHPHSLRHTFAVHYLNNGGNLVRLKQLLGHAHLSTTLLYLRYATIPLRDIDTPLDVLKGND